MFQHNTEGGQTNLLATLGKRSRLLQTRLAGTQWKVLVFGFAIPWKYYQCGATACDNVFDNVFDAELHVLFEKLKQKRIDNFALVGLMIVHDVPAHACFQERRRVLSPEWTEHFQVAMRHIVPFSSTFHGAKFRGHRARQEMMALCKLLEAVRDQKYWQEAFDTVAGSPYHYNPHLSIRTWTKRSLHGLPQVGMAVETSCELVHDVTGELLPPGTQITILQIRQGDCNTDGYVEVKVCDASLRLWLHSGCIRVPGSQCALDLEDASSPPLLAIEDPRASTQRPLLALQNQEARTSTEQALHRTAHGWADGLVTVVSDSTLLQPSEIHVCVNGEGGQPLGEIVGKYGGCFCDDNFRQTITGTVSGKFPAPGRRLRIGYVPAAGCHPRHEFPDHQTAQSNVFSSEWIPTPKLTELQGECLKETGVCLFSAKGVHCTEPGRLWLQRYLFRWGSRKEVSLIFCLGWNADAPQAADEYYKQVALVKVLQNSR